MSASEVITWQCDWCDHSATSYRSGRMPDGWQRVDVLARGPAELCARCKRAFLDAERRIKAAASDLWLPVIWERREASPPRATPES